MSSDQAHLKIPIDITPLKDQLIQAHNLSNELLKLSRRLGGDTPGGAYIKALSHCSDTNYQLLEQKYQTISYFYTRNQNYKGSDIHRQLQERKRPIDQIITDNLLQSTARIDPSHFSIDSGINNRRAMVTADEPEPKVQAEAEDEEAMVTTDESEPTVQVESEDEETEYDNEGFFRNFFYGSEKTSTSTSTTTVHPGIVDLSNPEAPETEVFDNPFEDSFFKGDHFHRKRRSVKGVLVRSKRFIGTLILSLLTSIGVGSIFGAIDASQLNTIKEAEMKTRSTQNLIIHELQKQSKNILTNRNMLNGLRDLTVRLGKYTTVQHFQDNGILLFIIMNAEYSRIHHSLDQFTQIVEASTHNRFHPGILSQHGGISAFEEIKAIAESRGLTPVIQNAQQMSQLHTNFYFTPTGITLVIDIPLCSNHNTFSLHKFTALPIKLGSEVYVKIIPENTIIAIGENDLTGHPKYVELSLMDLTMCQRLGKIYLCPEQRIVTKPNPHSCLYALYVSDHEAARQSCRINLEGKIHDQVVATGSDTFAYYSVTPSTFQYYCQNNSIIRGQQLAGISEIQVPNHCRVETAGFILHRKSNLYREASPKQYHWTLPVLTFLQNDTSITDITSAVKVIESTKGAPDIDTQTIEELKKLNKPFYMDTFPVVTFIVAISSLLLILAIIAVVVYKNCQANKVSKNLSDPGYRFKQMMKEETNLELLEQLLQRRPST